MSRVKVDESDVKPVPEQYKSRCNDSRQQTIKSHMIVALSSADPVIKDRAVKELRRFTGDPAVDECLKEVERKQKLAEMDEVTKARLAAFKRGGFIKKR